jgi:hypothetical protein
MASKERKSGSDLVLESRHLAGLFLLLVVIFGVVFTLGYLLGRSQYDTKLHAASGDSSGVSSKEATSSSKAKQNPEAGEILSSPKNADWDFYHSGEPKTVEDHLQPPATRAVIAKSASASKHPAVAAKAAKRGKSSVPLNAPLIPNGAVMLQVAAVRSQGDALTNIIACRWVHTATAPPQRMRAAIWKPKVLSPSSSAEGFF